DMCQKISAQKLNYTYIDKNRAGDHIWWISSVAKFKKHYPNWEFKCDIKTILREIYEVQKEVVV
ncbi:MAG: NAD-dependent epimerase, partial [Candidatus Brocadia sp.]